MNVAEFQRSNISDAGWLAVKVYAIAAMFFDHLDSFVYDGSLGFHATWGRTVFPIFALLLAYNLTRTPVDALLSKLLPRMLVFGMLAFAPYASMYGHTLPLNVMFTLAAAVFVVYLIRIEATAVAVLVFLLAGVMVDYAWFGLLAIVLPWQMYRKGIPGRALMACAAVVPMNESLWSFAALLPLALSSYIDGHAPRFKWAFYVAYPLHLALLWLLA